jgi:hypothetical protein
MSPERFVKGESERTQIRFSSVTSGVLGDFPPECALQ